MMSWDHLRWLRFHPKTSLHEVKALAYWKTFKCAAVGIPFCGRKGEVMVNPKELSRLELDVDILIPASLENQIKKNAVKVKALINEAVTSQGTYSYFNHQ